MITPTDLKNEDNLLQCECGNVSHSSYTTLSDEGNNTCPECQIQWMTDLLETYKKLLWELADPSLKKEDITTRNNTEIAGILGITLEDYEEKIAE